MVVAQPQAPGTALRLRTPELIAQVVGTRFDVARDAHGSRLTVNEGTVAILNPAGRELGRATAGARWWSAPGASPRPWPARDPIMEDGLPPGGQDLLPRLDALPGIELQGSGENAWQILAGPGLPSPWVANCWDASGRGGLSLQAQPGSSVLHLWQDIGIPSLQLYQNPPVVLAKDAWLGIHLRLRGPAGTPVALRLVGFDDEYVLNPPIGPAWRDWRILLPPGGSSAFQALLQLSVLCPKETPIEVAAFRLVAWP
jgi:hypothetical protein